MDADDYETLPTNNFGIHMTAGAIAGVMEHCVMYPLDSVKVSNPLKYCHTKSRSFSDKRACDFVVPVNNMAQTQFSEKLTYLQCKGWSVNREKLSSRPSLLRDALKPHTKKRSN